MIRPTEQTYQELQTAYTHFNRALYGGVLPDCLITMQRHARSLGYFRCKPFVNRAGDRTDEIALNPMYFAARSERGVLSTLGHEMAHLHQYRFGKPSRRGYHNREWANKMIEIGLYPSHTGEPGGAETGYQMTHYIVEAGPFDVSCNELLAAGFQLSWIEDHEISGNQIPPTAKAVKGDGSNRWKYTCPACGINAWGKPLLLLDCRACQLPMPRNLDD